MTDDAVRPLAGLEYTEIPEPYRLEFGDGEVTVTFTVDTDRITAGPPTMLTREALVDLHEQAQARVPAFPDAGDVLEAMRAAYLEGLSIAAAPQEHSLTIVDDPQWRVLPPVPELRGHVDVDVDWVDRSHLAELLLARDPLAAAREVAARYTPWSAS